MTKMILIKDSWMYSLGDLQRFFTENHINDDSLRLELLSLFNNGVLVDWLISNGEISKAKQIEAIDKKQREAQLCCDISNILGLNIKTVYRKNWKDVFSIRRVTCRKNSSTLIIDIPIFVLRNINENFCISCEVVFRNKDKVAETITINTIGSDYQRGCSKKISIKQKCHDKSDVISFSLSIDGETVYNTYAKTYVSSKDYYFDALTPSEYNFLTQNTKSIVFPDRKIEFQSYDSRVKFWQKIDWDISLTEFDITWSDIAAFTMFVIFVCLNYFWLDEYNESITSTFTGAFLQLALIIMPYSVGIASMNVYEKDTWFNDDLYTGILVCFLFLLAVFGIYTVPACIWDSWNYRFLNSSPLVWRIIFFVLSVAPFIAPIIERRKKETGFGFLGFMPGVIGLIVLLLIFLIALWNGLVNLYYYLFC